MIEARILKKEEENIWRKFVQKHPLATIHQMPEWGHFQEKVQSCGKYWIVVLENNGEIVGGSMILRRKIPGGYSWLYAARGPLLDYHSEQLENHLKIIIETLKPIAKKEKAIFFRIDPPLVKKAPEAKESEKTLHIPYFKPVKTGFQPEHTLILDVSKSKDDILAQMKQKGRYNIRLADKKGVKIRVSKTTDPTFEDDVGTFYQIFLATTQRDKFHGHPEEYYKNMLKTLGKMSELYLAEYEGQVIAGVITTKFKDRATYYFGASSNQYRNVMAPYLIHWKIIQDAKEAGFTFYDFFGISPPNAENHAWSGVTSFKKKFGGQEIEYQSAQEFAFNKFLYFLYTMYKKIS